MALEDTDVFDEVETEEPEQETEQPEVEAEKGEKEEVEVETESTEESPASKDEDSEVAGLKAAIKAERGRRQAAEKKLLDKQEQGKAPDPVTDPEGYDKYLKSVNESERLADRIELTQDLMRDLHDDFDKYQGIFMDLVSEDTEDGLRITDPQLLAKFNAAPNPAKFAYNHAKQHESYLDKTSPDYEEKLRKRIEQELLDKLDADPTMLPNLTKAAASQKNDVEVEDRSKDEIDAFDD